MDRWPAAEPQRQSAAATATPSVEGDTTAGRHARPPHATTNVGGSVRSAERTNTPLNARRSLWRGEAMPVPLQSLRRWGWPPPCGRAHDGSGRARLPQSPWPSVSDDRPSEQRAAALLCHGHPEHGRRVAATHSDGRSKGRCGAGAGPAIVPRPRPARGTACMPPLMMLCSKRTYYGITLHRSIVLCIVHEFLVPGEF